MQAVTNVIEVPDWVRLSGVSSNSVAIYWALKVHIREGIDSPTTDDLAAMTGWSRGDQVTRHVKQLVSIGAVEVYRRGLPARNFYVVHDEPPFGYTGPRTLGEWYEINAAVIAAMSARTAESALRRRTLERETRTGAISYSAILREHGMSCHICTGPIESRSDLHFDHVIPLSRGGTHTDDNIRPAHVACNQRKGDRLMSELAVTA